MKCCQAEPSSAFAPGITLETVVADEQVGDPRLWKGTEALEEEPATWRQGRPIMWRWLVWFETRYRHCFVYVSGIHKENINNSKKKTGKYKKHPCPQPALFQQGLTHLDTFLPCWQVAHFIKKNVRCAQWATLLNSRRSGSHKITDFTSQFYHLEKSGLISQLSMITLSLIKFKGYLVTSWWPPQNKIFIENYAQTRKEMLGRHVYTWLNETQRGSNYMYFKK